MEFERESLHETFPGIHGRLHHDQKDRWLVPANTKEVERMIKPPKAGPKIAYVCGSCWENNSEASCYERREELRITPNGEWMCDCCYEYDPDKDQNAIAWDKLPLPPEYIGQRLDEKDAEIARLKESFKTVNDLLNASRQENADQRKLITELADALEEDEDFIEHQFAFSKE